MYIYIYIYIYMYINFVFQNKKCKYIFYFQQKDIEFSIDFHCSFFQTFNDSIKCQKSINAN